MSGELILEKGGTKNKFLALLITAVVVILVMIPVARMMGGVLEKGGMTQIGFAILIPVLIWLVHPQMMKLLPGGQDHVRMAWKIADQTLTLGETVIPESSIKNVYCWKKDGYWLVNIETTGKNQLLRTAEGSEADASAQRLYALVDALGYSSCWREF